MEDSEVYTVVEEIKIPDQVDDLLVCRVLLYSIVRIPQDRGVGGSKEHLLSLSV